MASTCKECRFFQPTFGDLGNCCVRPPVILEHCDLAQFPTVEATMWCGAFKEDPDRLRDRHAKVENWDRALDRGTKGVLA